jgi:putative SOS response-associated peptidase YedK
MCFRSIAGKRKAPRLNDLMKGILRSAGISRPAKDVLAVRFRPKTGQRRRRNRSIPFAGGLVPYWAKNEKIAFKTINARVETIDNAPSCREAFKKRRCLIPADSFYEWRKVPGGKIPYAIAMQDDSPFVFAGLCEASRRFFRRSES